MHYRPFGSLDFAVSIVGFGGAAVSGEGGGYGFGAISEDDSIQLIRYAFEKGINLFDTAPIYGFGESERRIGKALKPFRERVFVVSKCGVTWHDNKRVNMTNDPAVARKMLEQSLRDLNTDYIDLYMIHWPDKQVDIRKPMEVLSRAKTQGKIRAIGLSNTHEEDLRRALEVDRVDVLQSEYNLFHRGIEESLWPLVDEFKLGMMSWGSLDKGILTGRVTRERKFDEYDLRANAPWWKSADRSWKYRAMERIKPLVEAADHTLQQMALGYIFQSGHLSTALCGAKSPAQINTVIAAIDKLPSSGLLDKARNIAIEEASRADAQATLD